MAHIVADRVKETTTTTGTGAVTLAGTSTGFRAFSAVCANGDTVFYTIAGGAEWEVGLGTWATGNTLTRTTVLSSSNGGSAVNLSAGTKDVFLTMPANGGRLVVPTVSSVPSAANPGTAAHYMRQLGGKIIPSIRGETEDWMLPRSLRGGLGKGVNGAAGSTTFTYYGGMAPITAVGTATAASFALTNLYTKISKAEFLVTAAATTAIAGFRQGASNFAREAGYYVAKRFGFATGVTLGTKRSFTGMRVAGPPTDVNPSSLTNLVGVGFDNGDANFQIMHNDGSGTATKVDLGASFVVPTADRTAIYELELYAPPNGSTVDYRFTDLVSGAIASGQITTDLPATTTLQGVAGWLSVGGTSSVIGYALSSVYAETEI